MPCTGPDLGKAEQQAIKANREIWLLLKNKYGILPNSEFGVNDAEKFYRMKELLKEIFVENSANGW